MTTQQCLRCGDPYDPPRRRPSHFCPPCRAQRKLEADRERIADVRSRLRNIMLDATIAENVNDNTVSERDHYLALMGAQRDSLFARAGDYVETLDAGTLWPLVPDRQPTGTNSPQGSDDGCSTNYTDLAEWLDQRARYIASGQWFIDNPHWSYALANPQESARYLRSAA